MFSLAEPLSTVDEFSLKPEFSNRVFTLQVYTFFVI